jgi:hypothetical protein
MPKSKFIAQTVVFAYPSSPDACRFGFAKSGCYVVSRLNQYRVEFPHSGHREITDAFKAANSIALPYDRYSLLPSIISTVNTKP